ncbi:14847_t:CDS:2 [Cetraspora pellucida]|uniref:14847_t:CDS:1 n=1 Tax=Cetraspora pellucida TaxID=1433469 RepID=A0ACA9LQZ7_9GLOM|nr:14847_t:CDS:2 [Cetraspora pellucida]
MGEESASSWNTLASLLEVNEVSGDFSVAIRQNTLKEIELQIFLTLYQLYTCSHVTSNHLSQPELAFTSEILYGRDCEAVHYYV